MVPKTPTPDTASQYFHAWYRSPRSWTSSATTKPTKPSSTAGIGLSARTIQSEVDSPNAVVRALVIQNRATTSGTLEPIKRVFTCGIVETAPVRSLKGVRRQPVGSDFANLASISL